MVRHLRAARGGAGNGRGARLRRPVHGAAPAQPAARGERPRLVARKGSHREGGLDAKLIDGRGWTRETYERWLAEALLRLLG